MKEKTRDLSMYEYLQELQKEYVVAELRRKIYTKKKDREYFGRVMKGKREKIEDISLRNTLPSIFTSRETRELISEAVYTEWGMPNFFYKRTAIEEELRPKDFFYYYYKNSEFKVKLETGEVGVGILTSVDQENDIVYIKLKGSSTEGIYTLNTVSRIL